MKTLRTNRKGKFILIKLMTYCQQRDIDIKYTILYFYKENSLVERRWKILVIIKDFY